MENTLIRAIQDANSEKWCMNPTCVTCGAFSFREVLRRMGGPLGWGVANALRHLDWKVIVLLDNWENAVIMALMSLQLTSQIQRVVEAWPADPDGRLEKVNQALQGYLNHLPENHIARKKFRGAGLSPPSHLAPCQDPV